MKNSGKIFEEDWKNSCPKTCFIERFKDNMSVFDKTAKYARENICDYVMHDDLTSTLLLLELKTTSDSSLTFWREDFDQDKKYEIRKNQIQGLLKASSHNLSAGLIINFRSYENRTFYLDIRDFILFSESTNKKSINMRDVVDFGGIEIISSKKRTRYRYDVNNLIEEILKNEKDRP